MRLLLIMLLLCAGCSSYLKKHDDFTLDDISGLTRVPGSSGIQFPLKPSRYAPSKIRELKKAAVDEKKYRIQLLDTMSINDFMLSMLSFISMNLVIDSSIELSVSCNFDCEMTESEILQLLSDVSGSLNLLFVRKGNVVLISKKDELTLLDKSVLLYRSKYLKSGQSFQDMLKSFQGVSVFSSGMFTMIVASNNDIKLIESILVSIDKDIFSGYVYSFVVCNDSSEFVSKIKTALVNVSSRYEEFIQIIPITDNTIMLFSVSTDYLKYVETLSSMMGKYIGKDNQSYSLKVRYRSIDDVLSYVKSVVGELKVVADSEQNVLYFSGSQIQFERVRSLVSAYDVMPYQLLVRLYMIDIKSNESLNAGSDWLVDSGSFNLAQTELIYPLSGGINSALTVGNIKSFFSFLEERFDAKVVSRPFIYLKSGQSAKIQIGSEVPFVTSKTSQSTVSTGVVQNVEYRDVGMIFNITSTVTDSMDIILDVSIENSAIQPKAGVESNPIFTTDNIKTKFISCDNSLTILGGIKFIDKRESSNGFPFLRSLPVLKYIFGMVDKSYEDRELIIGICPKVLDNVKSKEFGKRVFNNLSHYLGMDLVVEGKDNGKGN